MRASSGGIGASSPVRRIFVTTLLFALAGPMIAGPVAIPIIWYFSFAGMTVDQAVISGLFATLLGFWGIMAVGAVPGAAIGLTVGWFKARHGMTGIVIPVVAGLAVGAIWGMLIQRNVSEFFAVAPAVMAGSVLASMACWRILRWAQALRARRLP